MYTLALLAHISSAIYLTHTGIGAPAMSSLLEYVYTDQVRGFRFAAVWCVPYTNGL